MANYKITDLPATSLANLTDVLEKTTDPAGSATSEKVTLSQIKFLVTGNLSYASTTYVNNVSGVLQVQITNFYPTSNPSGYITGFNSGQYITSSQTGQFYPRFSNPSGYLTGVNTGNFISTSQTGQFYPVSNPSGFITGLFVQRSITGGAFNTIMINWSGASTFMYNLTGNTFFNLTGYRDGQTIVAAIKQTGSFTATFPLGGTTGVKWPSGVVPTQSTGSIASPKADVYTFVDIADTIYGNVVQNF